MELGKVFTFLRREELYNAEKYGYQFEVKNGYLFEKGFNLFTDFVGFLYKIKKDSPKNGVNYTIAKLIMNSVYGRLGMNPIS